MNGLPGAEKRNYIEDTDHELHVKKPVEGLMNKGSFFALRSMVLEQMAELAKAVLLTVQTVARHEPFAPTIETMSIQQERLSSIAKDAEYLAYWASGPQPRSVSSPDDFDNAHDEWISEAEAAAERMETTFLLFWLQLDELEHQVEQALHPIKPTAAGNTGGSKSGASWLRRLRVRRADAGRRARKEQAAPGDGGRGGTRRAQGRRRS